MKFIGLFSLVFVFCLAVTLFTPEVDARIKKIKIAKKVAKLFLLRGIRPKVVLAVPLPVPIPILRKANHITSSNSWGTPLSSTSYEIPSLASLPESILNLLRPALSTIAASALRTGQSWPSVPLDAWSSPAIESAWPAQAPVQQNAWPSNSNGQQQQEVVEQQQINNYA